MLYDQKRDGQVKIPCEGLTSDELEAFCTAARIQFLWVNPEDLTEFRAGTIEYPMRGVTVKFSTVQDWVHALAAIGDRVTEGGRYRSFQGVVVTTVCDAIDVETKGRVIVYRDEEGQTWTREYDQFFRVVEDKNGKLVPRYACLPAGE